MNADKTIGIFDSGMGGLSVLHRAMKDMPTADFIYYADEEHVPYGEKTKETVRGYMKDIFRFFEERNVSAVIVACNTATSTLSADFRASFPFHVIGMEPAVKLALDTYGKEKKVLVAATPITVKGEKLKKLIDKYDTGGNVDSVALPELVRFAEKGNFGSEEVYNYIEKALEGYDKKKYSSLVLGCTHFNYFKPLYKRIFGEIHLLDGNKGTVSRCISLTGQLHGEGKVEYFISGKTPSQANMEKIQKSLKRLEEVYDIN